MNSLRPFLWWLGSDSAHLFEVAAALLRRDPLAVETLAPGAYASDFGGQGRGALDRNPIVFTKG
jgi:hypothetical protein